MSANKADPEHINVLICRFESQLPGANAASWSIGPDDRFEGTIVGQGSGLKLRPLN